MDSKAAGALLREAGRVSEAQRVETLGADEDNRIDADGLETLARTLSGAPDVKKARIGIGARNAPHAQWSLSRGATFVIAFEGKNQVRWTRSRGTGEGRGAGEGTPEEALEALRKSLALDRAPPLARIGAGTGPPEMVKAVQGAGALLAHAPLEALLEALHRLGVHHTVSATPDGAHGKRRTLCEIFTYDPGEPGPARCYSATSGGKTAESTAATLARAMAAFLLHEPHAGKGYAGPPRAEEGRGEISALEKTLMDDPLEETLKRILDLKMRFALCALPRHPSRARFTATVTLQEGGRDTGASIRSVRTYEAKRESGSVKATACDAVAKMLAEERNDYHDYNYENG